MGATPSTPSHQPPPAASGPFGSCCSSPQGSGERAGTISALAQDDVPEGVRRLQEADEESRRIVMNARQRRIATVQRAEAEGLGEARSFEAGYSKELKKREAQLNREMEEFQAAVDAHHEKHWTKELNYASKRRDQTVEFVCNNVFRIRLELSQNAQEVLGIPYDPTKMAASAQTTLHGGDLHMKDSSKLYISPHDEQLITSSQQAKGNSHSSTKSRSTTRPAPPPDGESGGEDTFYQNYSTKSKPPPKRAASSDSSFDEPGP